MDIRKIIRKILSESLYKEDVISYDDKVVFDYSKKKGNINTSLGKNNFTPRVTTLPQSRVKVVSAYSKQTGKDVTDLLKSIKKTSDSPYGIDDSDYEHFLNRTALFFFRYLKDKNIDTIFVMESSSDLAKNIALKIKKMLPDTSIRLYNNSITKNIQNLKIKIDDDAKISQPERRAIESIYNKSKDSGVFSIKKINPKHRKYFIDWIEINRESINNITNKNILLFDDYITSGATLDEVSKELLKLSPSNIEILTLIK